MRFAAISGEAAAGSDTWPVTWADDGHLYTAFGDGWGFEPRAPQKLSMGLARIEGNPGGFQGVNIPSPGFETLGDGHSGPKASGMLMVDGLLIAAVRNAAGNGTQCRLTVSSDRGRTWIRADWNFEALGYCALLNFGRNYAGARDSFVYLYSPDTEDAYKETNRVVLARAPAGEVMEKEAWEYFAGGDGDEASSWSRNFALRQPVWEKTGGANRLDVVHNPGLGVYLMTMRSRALNGGLNHFSLHEAPEPWGPWTEILYEDLSGSTRFDWPGESQHIPSKWIAPGGDTLWMISATRDAFSLQRVVLEIGPATSRPVHRPNGAPFRSRETLGFPGPILFHDGSGPHACLRRADGRRWVRRVETGIDLPRYERMHE